jgi:hypothetical protein
MHIDIRSWTSAFQVTMHPCVSNSTQSLVTIPVPLSSNSPLVPGPPLSMDLSVRHAQVSAYQCSRKRPSLVMSKRCHFRAIERANVSVPSIREIQLHHFEVLL